MSVIVKGMEMPKNCVVCKNYYYCELWSKLTVNKRCKERHPDCPIVEVKEPHGRLGDLDALWDRMYNYIDNEGAKMPFGDNDFMIHKDSACELIEDAPTVIEAEGSKNE